MTQPAPHSRQHGGTDAFGAARWDFSTNSNACGPYPVALAALAKADPTRYPDPSYTALKRDLAQFHHTEPWRILLAGSASEAIQRLTAWYVRQGGTQVSVPRVAYGDYAHAAQAWKLQLSHHGGPPTTGVRLAWYCDPASPTGQGEPEPLNPAPITVLDRAYHPLRLDGRCAWSADTLDSTWQLWSPNKALGLTGVRGAYLIAPLVAHTAVQELEALAPSWPLGAHGVAMLSIWSQPATHVWLEQCRATLRTWRASQRQSLENLGWTGLPSDAPYACWHPGGPIDLSLLRARGIRLRDTSSMGLPGHYRLNTLNPEAQQALIRALTRNVSAFSA